MFGARVCPRCNKVVPATSRFCRRCGWRLIASPINPWSRGHARHKGSGLGWVFFLCFGCLFWYHAGMHTPHTAPVSPPVNYPTNTPRPVQVYQDPQHYDQPPTVIYSDGPSHSRQRR